MGTVWYAVQAAVWRQKTKEQKDNAFDKFLKDSKRKKCSVKRFEGCICLLKYTPIDSNVFFHEKR
jgi:hypothetical protein